MMIGARKNLSGVVVNYHLSAPIDMKRRGGAGWYRSCLLSRKRRDDFSDRIKHKTETTNRYVRLNGERDEKFPDQQKPVLLLPAKKRNREDDGL